MHCKTTGTGSAKKKFEKRNLKRFFHWGRHWNRLWTASSNVKRLARRNPKIWYAYVWAAKNISAQTEMDEMGNCLDFSDFWRTYTSSVGFIRIKADHTICRSTIWCDISKKNVEYVLLDALQRSRESLLRDGTSVKPNWARYSMRYTNCKKDIERPAKKKIASVWGWSIVPVIDKFQTFVSSQYAGSKIIDNWETCRWYFEKNENSGMKWGLFASTYLWWVELPEHVHRLLPLENRKKLMRQKSVQKTNLLCTRIDHFQGDKTAANGIPTLNLWRYGQFAQIKIYESLTLKMNTHQQKSYVSPPFRSTRW